MPPRASSSHGRRRACLFPQTLELLAERTHFTLAPLFDLGNLLLKGVKILLHRSQSGEHLALLPQLPLAFGLPTFRLRGGLFTLTFDSRLLGALRCASWD